MFYQKLTLILFFLACPVLAPADEAGFDEVCRIYTEAKNSHMPFQQLNNYIFDNVKDRVRVQDALDAHDAIIDASADVRYKIFKENVEDLLKRRWDCEAMKIMFGRTRPDQ